MYIESDHSSMKMRHYLSTFMAFYSRRLCQHTLPVFFRWHCWGIVASQMAVTIWISLYAATFAHTPVWMRSLSHSLTGIPVSSLSGSGLLIANLPAFLGAATIVHLFTVKRVWSLSDPSSINAQHWGTCLQKFWRFWINFYKI